MAAAAFFPVDEIDFLQPPPDFKGYIVCLPQALLKVLTAQDMLSTSMEMNIRLAMYQELHRQMPWMLTAENQNKKEWFWRDRTRATRPEEAGKLSGGFLNYNLSEM